MVEKTSDSSDSDVEIFDSSVRQCLREFHNNDIGLFIVGGTCFIALALCTSTPIAIATMTVHAPEVTGLLAKNIVHTCAFTGLLAKNMVSKLVLLGGKPFRV